MMLLALLVATLVVAPTADGADSSLAEARRIEVLIDAGDDAAARTALASGNFTPLIRATLEGRLALASGRPEEAERAFSRARTLAPDHAPLRILHAHAQVLAGHHRAAVSTLADGVDPTEPPVAMVLAAAQRGLGNAHLAYEALRRAALAHADDAGLHRDLVILSASQGLFEAARSWAERVDPDAIGPEVAAAVLSEARSRPGGLAFCRWFAAGFPDAPDVQAQLGWAESAAGHYASAARALERAAALGADTAYAAAEHYRAARRYRDALSANARVTEPGRRAGQRFDILFESGAMARAIVAGTALEESGGLSPRRRYALAHAHYALRQYAEATRHARLLAGTDEAERAEALLRAMGR